MTEKQIDSFLSDLRRRMLEADCVVQQWHDLEIEKLGGRQFPVPGADLVIDVHVTGKKTTD